MTVSPTATPIRLVDTHAHVMDAAFAADLPTVLERADASGVSALVCVGYNLATSRAAVQLAWQHRQMVATVGLHPNDVGRASPSAFDEIARLAEAPEVAAIGETGLDYYRDRTPPERQREALEWHLQLAERLGKPVVIHNREADVDVAPALEASAARRPAGEHPGVLHCFSSLDPRFLERMLDAGYYVSFAGTLTYKTAGSLRTMAQRVPLERLLVETDCPYLTPEPHRGRRNEPAYVSNTAERLASVLKLDVGELARHLWTNSLELFPLLDRSPVGGA